MNAIDITMRDLSKSLNTALRPVTVEAICLKLDKGWHTQGVLEHAFGIPRDTEINRAISRLNDLIEREGKKRDAKHWSYDPNRLIALRQHHNALGLGLLMRSAR
jgi:hypothetical protein